MSFWATSDGSAVKTQGEMQLSEDIKPIPNNTQLLALIDEAKWDDYDGAGYISLRWSIASGEYANRKVFQKLWVNGGKQNDKNPQATMDKAKRMLAAIDMNAGGKLMQSQSMPSDQELAIALMNKPMMIQVKVWSMPDNATGETKTGNWINAVAPRSKQQAQQPQQTQAPQQAVVPVPNNSFDDDVGF